MRLDEYQRQAVASDQSKGQATARYLLLGLFGEAGSVLTAVKKKERDKETSEKYFAAVTEELGDLFWYIATVAERNRVKLSALAAPLVRNKTIPCTHMEFRDLQQEPRFITTELT